MNVAVRAMSIEDYDDVLELWARTPGVGLSESDTRAGTSAFLARNVGMSAVAVVDVQLVGAVLCGHDGRRGYLHHLAVSSAWRGRGIGRQLLARCLDQLSSEGIPKCNVFLFSDNAAGAEFWQRNGWSLRTDLRVLQTPVRPFGKASA